MNICMHEGIISIDDIDDILGIEQKKITGIFFMKVV